LENIVERAVEPICPQMIAGSGINKLTGDTDAIARLPDRPLKNVTDAKLASDLLYVHRATFVRE